MSELDEPTREELTDALICLQDAWDAQAATIASLTRRLEWALQLRPVPQTWQERYGLGEERRG